MARRPRQVLERARTWAQNEPRVAAAFVHGSLAHGDENDLSDLDLIVVAVEGARDALWAEREQIAAQVLGGPIAWSHELPWQRPYRYQAWLDKLEMLDFTLDEGNVFVWHGLVGGVEPLVDRGDVEQRFRADIAALDVPEFDAPALDSGSWNYLNWLAGRLLHGQYWFVRSGLYDTLGNRIIPLLGGTSYGFERELTPEQLAAVTNAAPALSEPAELLRSLQATTALYDSALDRWAERTRRMRPQHPLAAAIRKRMEELVVGS